MEPQNSIYQRAAQWGVPFGLYLAATGVSGVFVDCVPLLSIVMLLLLVGVPVLTCYYQRRKFVEDQGFSEYAALWMLGIMLFLLGGVVASLVMYVVLEYVRPDFIYTQAQAVVDAYSQVPAMQGNEVIEALRTAIDKHALPSPIEMVLNTFWLISFGGSMLSALTALVAQRGLKHKG